MYDVLLARLFVNAGPLDNVHLPRALLIGMFSSILPLVRAHYSVQAYLEKAYYLKSRLHEIREIMKKTPETLEERLKRLEVLKTLEKTPGTIRQTLEETPEILETLEAILKTLRTPESLELEPLELEQPEQLEEII